MSEVSTNIAQKITANLWFDDQAEEAAQFYTSVFKNSKMGRISRYGKEGYEIHGKPEGTVLTVEFELEGQSFTALNGGPQFKFTPAISFMVNCTEKEEVDALWEKLSEGGTVLMPLDAYPFSERYGWIQDKYGLSWQLILSDLERSDPAGDKRPKFTPSLLFVGDNCGKAEEAMQHYLSIFKDSGIGNVYRYGAGQEPDSADSIMYADFVIGNQWFAVMDSAGEHHFTFNEATSLMVNCDNQEEVDYYWSALGEGGDDKAQVCGWLKDKYGVSWQIVPNLLAELMTDPDPSKSQNVMKAMLQMKKLDINQLKQAANS